MSQSLGVVAVVQPVQGVSRCWRCSVAELRAAPAFSGPVSFHEPASKGQLGGARQPCSSCVTPTPSTKTRKFATPRPRLTVRPVANHFIVVTIE